MPFSFSSKDKASTIKVELTCQFEQVSLTEKT